MTFFFFFLCKTVPWVLWRTQFCWRGNDAMGGKIKHFNYEWVYEWKFLVLPGVPNRKREYQARLFVYYMTDLNNDNSVHVLPILSYFCYCSKLWVKLWVLKNMDDVEDWRNFTCLSPQLCPWICFEKGLVRTSELGSCDLFVFARKQVTAFSQWSQGK